MGFPRHLHDVSMIFLWGYYWDSHGISLWFLCYSMLFLRSFYEISVGFLWDFHDISMIFLWDYYGMSSESKLKSIESKLKSVESKLKSSEIN